MNAKKLFHRWIPLSRLGTPSLALLAAILALATLPLPAATNNLTSLLQQGLFEEEANRNLAAAVANYQALAAQFDKDRQLAATAVFRLGECYRKLGQTNEAAAAYQRILREFSDETTLVALCRQNLTGLGVPAPVGEKVAAASSGEYVVKVGDTLSGILMTINRQFPNLTMNDLLAANPGLSPQRLRVGQKIALHGPIAPAAATVVIDDEETEIRRLQAMIQNSPDLKNAPSGEDKLTPLCRAAVKGQLRVAEFLLANGADVDQVGAYRTPLHHAANAGHKRMVELLLSHGANVNAKDGIAARTPLHLAVEKNFTAVAETLLTAKADVNAGDVSAMTPLMLAVRNSNRTLVAAILARGGDPNLMNKIPKGGGVPSDVPAGWGSSLHFAIARRDAALTALLLTNRASVELRAVVGGCTPLDLAAYVSATEVAALLIAAGADVNAAGPEETGGATPLHRAAGSGHRDTVKLLLEHGANPNATATVGERYVTPLMQAAASGDAEIATLLLEHKADANLKDGKGNTALLRAINANKPAVVRTLLAHGADANLKTPEGYPPLIIAAANGKNMETVNALLEAKADVNATDQSSKTTLHYVTEMGDRELVRLLLGAQADVNVRDRNGNAPLHMAVRAKNQEIVELLLAAKADPNVRDGNGQTPLDLAKGTSRPSGRSALPVPMAPGGGMSFRGGRNVEEKAEQPLADLLRQHGAIDDLANTDRIEVRRPSAGHAEVVFSRGTHNWNRFSLLELLGKCFGMVSSDTQPAPARGQVTVASLDKNKLRFPEFGKVTIHRAMEGGQLTHIGKDVGLLFESGDCSGDVVLEWGDWVEIPEADHPVDQKWSGLGTNEIATLVRCVSRTVTLIVKGTTNSLTLGPEWSIPLNHPRMERVFVRREGRFMLNAVLRGSGLIRASSDLTRVKVTRPDPEMGKTPLSYQWHKVGTNVVTCPDPASGKPREWTLDCSSDKNSDLWLRNGDVIEVPEK